MIKGVIILGILGLKLTMTPQELLRKVDEVYIPASDEEYRMRFEIIERDKPPREFEIKVYIKKKKRLIRFTYPPQVKGMAVLSLENDVMYLYMPSFRKVRRIAAHVRNQTFMGTDYSYDDMTLPSFSEYYEPITAGVKGDYYLLVVKPKRSAKKAYSQIDLYVHPERFLVYKLVYYKEGKPVKIEERKKWRWDKKVWLLEEIEMKNLITGRITRCRMIEGEAKPLSDRIFTKSALIRGE